MNYLKITLVSFVILFNTTNYFAQDVKVGDESALNVAKAEEFYNSGTEKFNAKDYAGAIADFDSALVLVPTFEKAIFNRGSVKFQQRDYSGAIADLNSLIQINPNYDGVYFLKARSHYEKNEKDKACLLYTSPSPRD